jgi:hypothetical protein
MAYPQAFWLLVSFDSLLIWFYVLNYFLISNPPDSVRFPNDLTKKRMKIFDVQGPRWDFSAVKDCPILYGYWVRMLAEREGYMK